MTVTDKERALQLVRVSRETSERLDIYEALLRKWQGVKNLVAPGTLDQVWSRHFADSLQLLDLAPGAIRWADIGSGAGFPGLVIAIALADVPGALVHLIESDNRKCAFLREVARETRAAARVEHCRAEEIVPTLTDIQVVTARAVAPIDKLVETAYPLLAAGAIGLFPKGREHKAELTRLALPSNFQMEAVRSLTDSGAAILRIQGFRQSAPTSS